MRSVLLAVSLLLALPSWAGSATVEALAESTPEVFRYRWRLEGVQGLVARLFGVLPTSGDGVMTLRTDSRGLLEVRFEATSEKAAEGDHWTYETLVDTEAWRTLRVRETYRFRKKERDKSFELAEREVIDVLSGLQQLRTAPRGAVSRKTIWSDGKTYPVTVEPRRVEVLEIEGRRIPAHLFELRGSRVDGERFWAARADVWLSTGPEALPVEMLYRQRLGRLRLTLVDPQP